MDKMTGAAYKKFIVLSAFLFACSKLLSQNSVPENLRQSFTQYQINNFQEKIFVHTDKTFYLTGETIWLKIYNVDANFNKLSEVSKICYIEILSKDQKPVLQAKIALQNGTGNGSFMLPSSIASGNYTLRAYTNWMKNFDADFYYEQPVTIVNTLKQTTAPESPAKNNYDVQFFPEGGNLVADLSSKIAFKAINQFGKGVNCTGAIINQQNDTLTAFRSLHMGMGNFLFTPKKGIAYKAVVRMADTVIVKQFPPVYDNGYVMQVSDSNTDQLQIVVSANAASANTSVFLFVQSHNLVKDVQSAQPVNGKSTFVIDKKLLGDGISQFTIFNADKQPLCERLYFKKPGKKLIIEANCDRDNYATRKKISIALSAKDLSNQPLSADMSVSVFLIDSLQSLKHADILSYLMLTSELKGNIESPEYYFESNDATATAAIDNLMLTQGWRRFNWQNVLQSKKPYFEFIPENEGPVIQGRITNKKTGLGADSVMVWLTVPGQNFVVTPALSKSNGDLRFYAHNFYSSNEVIVQTNYKTDSLYNIDITNAYSDKVSSKKGGEFFLPKTWKKELEYHSINTQAENAYLIDKKQHHFSFLSNDTLPFYGNGDKQYYLDDYTRFITMEEVMREYVNEVRVRKEADKFYFRANNLTYKVFFKNDPLILLDGIPVFNADKVMELDPLKIRRIDIVERKYYLGPLVSEGIVSFKTYNGDLAGYRLDPNAVVLEYEGLQQQREFYSPVYETEEQIKSRIPDFRNLLFWSPAVKTGTDGKTALSFYTSDLPGRFAAIIEGITSTGLSGSRVATFDVK